MIGYVKIFECFGVFVLVFFCKGGRELCVCMVFFLWEFLWICSLVLFLVVDGSCKLGCLIIGRVKNLFGNFCFGGVIRFIVFF